MTFDEPAAVPVGSPREEPEQRHGFWTPPRAAAIKRQWALGHSTKEIAVNLTEAFGVPVTKSMICAKARRMGLPIRIEAHTAAARQAREGQKRLGPGLDTLKHTDCAWPFGDPKDEGFHFCGAPVARKADGSARPYCAEHTKLAYVRPSAERTLAERKAWHAENAARMRDQRDEQAKRREAGIDP